MRRTLSLLAISLLVSSPAFAAWPAESLQWKCNDNAADTVVADASGNAHDGTFTGGKNTSGATVTGKINSALTFDGSVDYIDAGNILNPGTGNYSITLWFKTSTHGASSRGLMGKDATSAQQFGLYIQNAGAVRAALQSSGANYQVTDAAGTQDDGVWHHAAMTWNGTSKTLKLYVDNVDQGAPFLTGGTVGDLTNSSTLKAALTDVSLKYVGDLDDIRVFQGNELTAAQVSAIYNGGAGTETSLPNLEGGGSTIYDQVRVI